MKVGKTKQQHWNLDVVKVDLGSVFPLDDGDD